MRQAHPDQPLLMRGACTDDISILALSLMRFVAAGYMTSDVAPWETAHDVAESALGAVDGQNFVAAMVGIMRAIRAERAESWPFMPATCCRLTTAEGQLVRLFVAARAGEVRQLAEVAQAIAGKSAPRLHAAALVAASLMEAHASFQVARKPELQRPLGQTAASPTVLH